MTGRRPSPSAMPLSLTQRNGHRRRCCASSSASRLAVLVGASSCRGGGESVSSSVSSFELGFGDFGAFLTCALSTSSSSAVRGVSCTFSTGTTTSSSSLQKQTVVTVAVVLLTRELQRGLLWVGPVGQSKTHSALDWPLTLKSKSTAPWAAPDRPSLWPHPPELATLLLSSYWS